MGNTGEICLFLLMTSKTMTTVMSRNINTLQRPLEPLWYKKSFKDSLVYKNTKLGGPIRAV